VTVVMEEDGPMPLGEVTEVLRPELPTTQVAATNVSRETSDGPATDVSTASRATRVPAARAPAAVPPCESSTACQRKHEEDRQGQGAKMRTRGQRPITRRELHGGSLVASPGRVKGIIFSRRSLSSWAVIRCTSLRTTPLGGNSPRFTITSSFS
jgi:hypothetical protein